MVMAPKKESSNGGGKMTKEEERLLLESTRQVTGTTSALFYGNGFIVSALPISMGLSISGQEWILQVSYNGYLSQTSGLYWRVQVMDPLTYGIFFVVLTILSTVLVSYAYRKMKISLKHKIALKRDSAVSKEVLAALSQSNGKKLSKAEKDERIAWKKNEVAEGEATTFAIFYINTLFLFLVLCAFYFLRSFHPLLNYIGTTGLAGVVLVLLATGS